MTGGGEQPLHLGGPFGLAVLAVFAGLSGLLYFTGDTSAKTPVQTAPAVTAPLSGPVADPFYTPAPGTPASTETIEPVVQPQVIEPPPVTDAPRPPRPQTGPVVTVTPPKPPPQSNERIVPAQEKTGGAEITYIVKIKGSDAADTIGSTFLKSPSDAKKAWSTLLKERPALAGFRLVDATGSGELILGYTMPGGQRPSLDDVARVQKKLLAIDGVAYADPDSVAHPGKE